MSSEVETLVGNFISAPNIRVHWDIARQLMAARRMQHAAGDARFRDAFISMAEQNLRRTGLEQFLAIDLVVRVSDLVKRDYTILAAELLASAMETPIDGMWSVIDAKMLPPEAKASEIRENIAIALGHASGSWVVPYLAEALAREDRSQRVRIRVCELLVAREPNLEKTLSLIAKQRWHEIVSQRDGSADRAARLRDIALALLPAVRQNRNSLTLEPTLGPTLASFGRTIVALSPRSTIPPKLSDSAVALVGLLDELLISEFSLANDDESYALLGLLADWWRPLPYPSVVSDALAGLARKLQSIILLRARMGQRSERLATRLSQALGAGGNAASVLWAIAEVHPGLPADIDDWLRGRQQRKEVATAAALRSAFSATGTTDFVNAFAAVVLLAREMEGAVFSSEESTPDPALRRLLSKIDAISEQLHLEVRGKTSEEVEFDPNLHRTADDHTPSNPMVTVLRPMVIRRRADGSVDVIERAIVS